MKFRKKSFKKNFQKKIFKKNFQKNYFKLFYYQKDSFCSYGQSKKYFTRPCRSKDPLITGKKSVMLRWSFESIFHLDGSLASNLDVDGHCHCDKVPVDKILANHQFVYSIGTSYNCEYDQRVEEYDGPGADSRPNRCGSPIVHVRERLSRNLDVDLEKMIKVPGHLRS